MISSLPALRARLLADAGVATLIATRLYSFEAPQDGVLPDAVIYIASGPKPEDSMAGTIPPWSERISIEARSTKLSEVDALGAAIVNAVGNATFSANGVVIDACLVASNVYDYDREFRLYRRIVDFRVSYRPF